jgi:hypothetical protein
MNQRIRGSLSLWPVLVELLLILGAFCFYSRYWSHAPLTVNDTPSYQAVARDLTQHHALTRLYGRPPGYPLLLALTGSVEQPTRALYHVQLALYLLSVILLLRVARKAGAPGWTTVVFCVTALLPPYVEPAAYALTEAPTTFLLVLALWSMAGIGTPLACLLGGCAGGLAGLFRPTYLLLGVVLASLLYMRARKAALLALAGCILVVTPLVLYNGLRFGWATPTPYFGWNLSTRTVHFLERLPDSPLKRYLIKVRDTCVQEGGRGAAPMYIWHADRDSLSALSGKSGFQLDKYMTRMNLGLIAAAPFNYEAEVEASIAAFWKPHSGDLTNFSSSDELPGYASTASRGVEPSGRQSRYLQWIWQLLQALVLCAFVLQAVAIIGSWLVSDAPPRNRAIFAWLIGSVMVLYTMLVSCLLDIGDPRYRSPVDGIVLATALIGFTIWTSERRRRSLLRERNGNATSTPVGPTSGRLPG